MAVTTDVKNKAGKKPVKPLTKEETVIRYGFASLAFIIGLCVIYFVVSSLIPTYYVKVGDYKVNENEFMYQTNMQYNVFSNYYSDYITALGYDLTTADGLTAFMTASYDEERTFGQFILESTVDSIQELVITLDLIEQTGFDIDEAELDENLALQMQTMQSAADEVGYTLDEYAGNYFGTSLEAMQSVMRNTFQAEQYNAYLIEQYKAAVTEDRAKAYYDSVDDEGNATKDDIDEVTIVSVLKKTVTDDLDPLSADVIAAAKAVAEDVYAKALAGEDIYALAAEFSDEAVTTDEETTDEETTDTTPVGEYTIKKADVQIMDIADWAFSAKVGDVGFLETDIGYIVIKLMNRADYEDMKDDVFTLIANSDWELNMEALKDDAKYEIGLYNTYTELYLTYANTEGTTAE
ncbi:MAG: peptidylprolyl isomerase [Clostridia bacterium]